MKQLKAKDEFVVGKYNIGWVSSTFLDKFGDTALGKDHALEYKDLPKNMYDREIIRELGAQEVELADILYMFDHDGSLLKNGYSNLFYVGGLVVSVHWRAASREWAVFGWRLDDGYWDADYRVFSRYGPSVPMSSAVKSWEKFLQDFHEYCHAPNPEGKTELIDYKLWADKIRRAIGA